MKTNINLFSDKQPYWYAQAARSGVSVTQLSITHADRTQLPQRWSGVSLTPADN